MGWGVYILVTAVATIWSFISVLAVHCDFGTKRPHLRGPRIHVSAQDVQDLRRCHQRVEKLLLELHRESYELQARALKYKIDPASEWRNWSEAWRGRWRVVDWRCRLGELGGKGVSAELDQLYEVHRALDGLQMAYSGVMDRFVEQHSRRLRALHAKLRKIRDAIEGRAKSQALAPPKTPSGAKK